MRPVLTRATFLAIAGLAAACGGEMISSRAYKGHESDIDANNFVTAYPDTLGTRLDDCQTCHRGDTFSYAAGSGTLTAFKNACDYCHLITHPQADLIEPQPEDFGATLNPFGVDYLAAGRSTGALGAIGDDDSDGDGHANGEEIADLKYPGDPNSKPGQEIAPMVAFTEADLRGLPVHEQLLLANSHKQEYDTYAVYEGVKIVDLLAAAGADPASPEIQGITVIAPDGYRKDFTIGDIRLAFPDGLFYGGLDNAGLGIECGFVEYPDELPSGLTDGAAIPSEQWLMLAYERDDAAMDPCYLDLDSGKINGEGPYRIVVPQSNPGSPDRGSNHSPTTCNDGWDYDDSKDHNAGAMVRGVVAVRINPLPAGYEDFDYHNGGWAFIDNASLIVYGTGVAAP